MILYEASQSQSHVTTDDNLIYSHSVGLLGRVISPIARPVPTQDTAHTKEHKHP
jgi:hypothetical protein